MTIKRFIQKLFSSRGQEPSPDEISVSPSKEMQKMLAMLSKTQDVELTCDEVFALLDQFTELAAQGENVAQLMPLVQQHLDMCGDCQEEYKVLESILYGAV
jgi:predicted component of type VI protein secretion system